MASGEDDLEIQTQLRRAIRMVGKPISYGALARQVKVEGPGSIARVTAALETMMHQDYAAGRPFLAAMCEGKLSGGLPALGFFQMAATLGRYTGPPTGPEAAAFVAQEREMLASLP